MGARRQVSGNDLLLFIDPAGGTDWKLVVCLTGNSLETATNIIDASSKCGPYSLPGNQTVKIDFAYHDVLDTTNSELSDGALRVLQLAKTTISFKFGYASTTEGAYVYTGTGFIASVKTDAQQNDVVKGTGSIGVYGTITTTYTGS